MAAGIEQFIRDHALDRMRIAGRKVGDGRSGAHFLITLPGAPGV